MSDTTYKISVMQAYERGEKIEYKRVDGKSWKCDYPPIWDRYHCDYRIAPIWDWYHCDYRIAPKPLECWVVWKDDEPLRATTGSVMYADGQRLVKMREVTE